MALDTLVVPFDVRCVWLTDGMCEKGAKKATIKPGQNRMQTNPKPGSRDC